MHSGGVFTMNQKELNRHDVIARVCKRELKQSKAAQMLGISPRQIKRLCHHYRKQGVLSLVSKRRGKPSNNRIPEAIRQQIIGVAKKKYSDFGPTFMAEKLLEHEKITISKESLRQLLIAEGLWKAKRSKETTIHPQRERRACFGELVQIDGSPHDWFEGRAEKCCLIVFIDDATSEILYLRFEPVETTQAYFRGLFAVIQEHGLMPGLYSDKHGIFRVNQGDDPEAQTQLGIACERLNIELINADSPQAKGRVERANKTLQDRLVKELRLANISDMKSANAFLETYRPKYNQKFAKIPSSPEKAFMANTYSTQELTHILSEQEVRKVTKNLEISFENKIYQIQNQSKGRRLQQASVTVCRTMTDEIILLYQGQRLEYKVFQPNQKRPQIADEKSLNVLCDQTLKDKKLSLIKPHKPAASHPWRHMPISPAAALLYEQRIT
jgi:transposase